MQGAFGSSFHHHGTSRSSPFRARRYAFIFVCQRGDTEVASMLLAASLRKFLRCRNELIACIHAPDVWGAPEQGTLDFLKRLGARTETLQVDSSADPSVAVRVACLRATASAEKIVLLSSDTLAMAPFQDDPRFTMPLNVKPEGDIFSDGFVAVTRGTELADAWRTGAGPAALAEAARKLGLPCDRLDERFGFPLATKPLRDAPPPLFCRYGDPRVIRREPQVNALVHELASEHDEIASAMAANPAWAALLRPYAVRPRRRWWPSAVPPSFEGPDLVVLGTPGSGTDRLCEGLGRYSNCIVTHVHQGDLPSALVALRDIRRRVLDGETPAPQSGGTARIAHVDASDFVLASSWPSSWCGRLDELVRTMPDARFVAMVREPVESLASPSGASMEDRAREWVACAEAMLRHRDRLVLIRYGDFAADPRGELRRILAGWRAGRPVDALRPFAGADRPADMAGRDREVVRDLCAGAARDLEVPVA